MRKAFWATVRSVRITILSPGEGLHTKNFSWYAACFYLMYENVLAGDGTTCQTGIE